MVKTCGAAFNMDEEEGSVVYFSYPFLFENVLTVFERTEGFYLPRLSTCLWFSKWRILQSHNIMQAISLMSFDLFISSLHL